MTRRTLTWLAALACPLPSLSAAHRAEAEHLLRTPLTRLAAEKTAAAHAETLARRLETYLEGYTEIHIG